VMGLMLGDFVDEYTVRVVDVFAMPQVLLHLLLL
jgi:26S proteasome regulatory subunit N11